MLWNGPLSLVKRTTRGRLVSKISPGAVLVVKIPGFRIQLRNFRDTLKLINQLRGSQFLLKPDPQMLQWILEVQWDGYVPSTWDPLF